MILEALVTTLEATGAPHLAPMGPRVPGPNFDSFVLRPFNASNTYKNLSRHREGVLHVTDDALLMARAAVGEVREFPATRAAEQVRGFVLADCCRYFEFAVRSIADNTERVTIEAEVVCARSVRDFFGFNRARNAVLEAAIFATRLHFLPLAEVRAEFAKLRVIVEKTGGAPEHEALELLEAKLSAAEAGR